MLGPATWSSRGPFAWAQRHTPRVVPAARSLPGCVLLEWGVLHTRGFGTGAFLSAISPRGSAKPAVEDRVLFSLLSNTEPNSQLLLLSVHRLSSVLLLKTDLFLTPQLQLQSKVSTPHTCFQDKRHPVCTIFLQDGCSSPELLASHGRSEATGKNLDFLLAVLLSTVPGCHLTRSSSSIVDSVCPPWCHRQPLG